MRASRFSLVVAAAATTISCGEALDNGVSGSWVLEAVNGDPVPIVVSSAPEPRILRNGLLLLYPDGHYTYDQWIQINGGGSVRVEGASAAGMWSAEGDEVHLTDAATGRIAIGTASGISLRVTFDGDLHQFRLVRNDATLWQPGIT